MLASPSTFFFFNDTATTEIYTLSLHDALPILIEAALAAFGAEGGSISNIGSTASVAAYPTLSIYVASKSAVNGLTRVLSKELGPRKIRVNALSPGGTETEGAHAAGVMGAEAKKQI